MKRYDVIIVGAGPAGLKCAEVLCKSDKKVLLIDKEEHPGDKLCAGGLTLKGIGILPLPDQFIEQKITKAAVHSVRQKAVTHALNPFLFTINRKKLATYQLGLLDHSRIDIITGNRVTAIEGDEVVLKDGTRFGFEILVGADGFTSVVRKHLNLPVRKKLIGFQYDVPVMSDDPILEIYLDSRRFKSWYAWIFPHRENCAVGCICDPAIANHKKILENFHGWLKKMNIDPGMAKLESYPISYDFRGFRFGNVFLAGEAAGMASGLSGEGIYQSLVSGQEVAKMIMDPQYTSQPMDEMLKYNRMLERWMHLFRSFGPLRGLLFEFLIFMMKQRRFRKKINASFS